MKKSRTSFPYVFWVANAIEIFERFAYYGIYMGFGIYLEYLGYSKSQLGIVQSIFLAISYLTPVISGTMADRYGFKKVLLISYLAYIPSILLLIYTKSFSGIALTMLSIGLAAGIFKPLVSGTVRLTTDKTNTSLGFGIFYAMVNLGASFGPLIAGKLRAISWDYAFIAAAISVSIMTVITLLFYQEPAKPDKTVSLKQKFAEIWMALSDLKFLFFLVLIGLFFWLPLWSFFNILAIYIDKDLDTIKLYIDIKNLLGDKIASFISTTDENGNRRLLGETISHTGYVIILFQLLISWIFERYKAIPSFLFGLFISAAGFLLIGLSGISAPAMVFAGIFLFAVGEMISSPRIQEYITWLAPKEKAGLYMGSNFLATGLGGALSGVTFTSVYGYFRDIHHPEYIWYLLSAYCIFGILVLAAYTKIAGKFKEMDS